jgi:predicted dehydrogenase
LVLSYPHPISIAHATQSTGIAIFGAGRWGNHLLRNFLAQPQAKVVAVVDPDGDRLGSLAHQYGLTDEVFLATDWSEVLHLPNLDAIVVATPAMTHYPVIRAALEQGLHVLAEKPLTLTVQESLDLCYLAEKRERQLVIDHTYLFHPAVQQGRAIAQAQELGSLRYGYADRTHLGPIRQDVDALWDLAIHDIVIFNHWLNETPCQVQAQGTVWLQSRPVSCQFPRGLSDLVWVILTYPSGFQAFIHLCWANPDKQRRLSLVGDRASLIFDELQQEAPLVLQQGQLEQDEDWFNPVNLARQVVELPKAEPLQAVCRHFLDCVRSNTPSEISSGWLGADLVRVLSALTESLNRDGQAIKIER